MSFQIKLHVKLCVGTVCYIRILQNAAQTEVARVESSIQQTREVRNQGKHKESLAHSQHKLPGSEIMGKQSRDRRQCATGQNERSLTKKRFDKEIEAVALKIE